MTMTARSKRTKQLTSYRRVYRGHVAERNKAKAIIEGVMHRRSTGMDEGFALANITGAIRRMTSAYEHWDYTSKETAYLRRYYPEALNDPTAKPDRYAPDSWWHFATA